jgi:multidrug efflux pump
VRDRVLRVRSKLPDDIEEPVIAKQDADASPFIWIVLYGEDYSMLELSDIAERFFKDRLQTLSGVGGVIIGGEKRKSIRVWLDTYRLAAYHLTVTDIASALSEKSVNLPSGRIEGASREFSVFMEGELNTPQAIANLVIRTNNNVPIRIGEVARVAYGPEDDRKLIRYNGKTCVGVGIIKQSKSNALEVARLIKEELKGITPGLPDGLEAVIGYNSTIFIDRAIREVRDALFLSAVLVTLVIFFFLRTLRATFIPTITIPASLIATFTAMYYLDFSINILTILGLTLAIGLVVDDSIVVLETIYRGIEEGEDPKTAAFKGMKRVSFAVLSTTVVLIAVFIPLAFITGNTGRLFREFGITLSIAVSFSTFFALTLTPMLCSIVLGKGGQSSSSRLFQRLETGFNKVEEGYSRLLTRSIKKTFLVIAVTVVVSVAGVVLYKILPSEFLPVEDRSVILTIMLAPEGSTLDYTLKYVKQVEQIMLSQPEVERVISVVGLGIGAPGMVSQGLLFSTLLPLEERSRKQQEIVKSIFPRILSVPGILAFPVNPPALGRTSISQPISFVVKGNDYEQLFNVTEEIIKGARSIPGVINLNSDLKLNKPELLVEIDRNKANDLGVSVRNIATTLQVQLGGKDFATFEEAGEQYNVMVQLEKESRSLPDQLAALYLRGDQAKLIQLSNLVSVSERTAPRELNHYDRRRAVTITGSLLPGYTLGETLTQLEAIAADILPPDAGYQTAVSGESREFKESGYSLIFAFNLALIVIFLALAAQFESFTDPLTILLTVPLGLTGAFGALYLAGMTINLYSQIGLVMLVGLATKNGILIVEFANQLRAEGRDIVESVLQAARLRFRPVLMTAISTIFGMLPIAFSTGAGSESRSPMGMVVIGGMLLSTLLTLVIIPIVHISLLKTLQYLKR